MVRSRADLTPWSGSGTNAVADRPLRGVVDASVLIAHLNREEGRYEKSRELLLDAEEGRVELWAPIVIQVEVTRWSREVDPADADARGKLEAFLESDWLQAVEVDQRMARIARDVVAATPVRPASMRCTSRRPSSLKHALCSRGTTGSRLSNTRASRGWSPGRGRSTPEPWHLLMEVLGMSGCPGRVPSAYLEGSESSGWVHPWKRTA